MNWEIFTYASGDKLRMVLNAVASIFGNDDYGQAVAVVALLAFIGYLIMSAFDQRGINNFRWFLGMVFFYFAVLVPKTDVIITDRIVPSNSAVVSNVPLGLAMTAGFFSKTGDWFARANEVVFSMPNQLNYTENGLLFGHSMLESASKMRVTDGRTRQNLIEFIKSCVVIDGLGMRRFNIEDLERSPNLLDFFSNNVAQNAARFAYIQPGGSVAVEPCRPGFNSLLRPDIEAQAATSMRYAGVENHWVARITGGAADAQAKMDSQIQNALNYLTGWGGSSAEAVNQFSMTNALADGWVALNKELNFDAGMQSLVLQKAERERESTFHATAKMVDDALPMLKAIFECFIYAIFPIVALIALLSPAKVGLGYIKALVWINLWAPIYVILHFFGSYYDVSVMREIMGTHGGGFSAFANTALIEKMMTTKNTVAYLATSIPLIAWMLISQSGAMMSGFAGRVLQGYDQAASSAAGEGASGQLKLGGHDIREVPGSSMMQNSPQGLETSHLSGAGQQITSHADGSSTISNPISRTELDASVMSDFSRSLENDYTQLQMMTEGLRHQQTESSLAGLAAMDSYIEQAQRAETHSSNFGHGDKNSLSYAQSEREAMTDRFAEQTGVGKDRAIEIMGQLSAGIKGGTPLQGLVGSGAYAEMKAALTGKGQELTKEEWNNVTDYVQSDEFARTMQYSMEATLTHSAQFGGGWSQAGSESLQASYTEQQQATREYSVAFQETEAASQRLAESERMGEKWSASTTDYNLEQIAQGEGVSKEVAAYQVREAARNGDIATMQSLLAHVSPALSRESSLPGVDIAQSMARVDRSYDIGRGSIDAGSDENAATVAGRNSSAGVTRGYQESIVNHRQSEVEQSRQHGVETNAGAGGGKEFRDIMDSEDRLAARGEEHTANVQEELRERDRTFMRGPADFAEEKTDSLVSKIKGWFN